MKNKKIILIGSAALLLLTGCKKDLEKNAEISNENTEIISEGKSENKDIQGYEIFAEELETDKKFKNEILEKDKNLVFIWQPSCHPCETEMKLVEEIYKDYGDIGILGLGYAENKDDIINATRNWGITFKNYKMEDEFLEKYGDKIQSTPTILFVDREGNEIAPMKVGSSQNQNEEKALEEYRELFQGLN